MQVITTFSTFFLTANDEDDVYEGEHVDLQAVQCFRCGGRVLIADHPQIDLVDAGGLPICKPCRDSGPKQPPTVAVILPEKSAGRTVDFETLRRKERN
jgi:hypothetical protein